MLDFSYWWDLNFRLKTCGIVSKNERDGMAGSKDPYCGPSQKIKCIVLKLNFIDLQMILLCLYNIHSTANDLLNEFKIKYCYVLFGDYCMVV